MKLTDKTIAGLEFESGKIDRIIFDENFAGFGLRIRGAGKTWIFQYAFGSGAKRTNGRVTLGKWPALPAAKARAIAEDLYARVKLGGHPSVDKQLSREAAGHTFGKLVDAFLEFKQTELRPRSYAEIARHLRVYARALHGVPVTAIDLRRVVNVIDIVAKERGAVSANRAQTTIGSLFSWGMRKGLAITNPLVAAQMRRERARDRVLSDGELASIWNAPLDNTDFADIIRLLILSGARAAEIGSLRWDEINLDQGVISLPGERVKNGRAFEIPMSEPMRAILQRRAQSRVGDLVFSRSGNGFRRWGWGKAMLDAKLGNIPHWTIHDLRRTAATRMADIGILPHVIEACLNHISGHKAGVAGIYNRSAYSAEKRQALDQWGAHVIALAEGRKSNITALKRA